jgi:hypothetical protein
MGRKSKELSEDRKQLVVDLKREGVTISTRKTDHSHFLIIANTYEAALYIYMSENETQQC